MNNALCALLFLSCAYLHGYDAAADAEQADRIYRKSMNGRDVVVLERLLAEDFLFIRRTGEIWDKKEFLDVIRAGKLVAEVQEKHLRTRFYGDTAIMTHMDSLKIRDAATIEMIATRVFVKQRGVWKLASVQDTVLPSR